MTPILITPKTYTQDSIETNRIFPLFDNAIEVLLQSIHNNTYSDKIMLVDDSVTIVNPEYKSQMFTEFKTKFQSHIEQSQRNKIVGLAKFLRVDIIQGCTQYIDNLYIKLGKDNIQVMEREYTYHYKLNPNLIGKKLGELDPNKSLIISSPFITGSQHNDFDLILNECSDKNIDVHVDAAWVSAAKNINLDLNHTCIKSIGFSMSKGYGLSGWNRIGLRYTIDNTTDSICIMNEYSQVPTVNVQLGNYMLDNLKPDHLWDTHEKNYIKVCNDFDLIQTDTIHVGLSNGYIHGIAPLLRYLEKE